MPLMKAKGKGNLKKAVAYNISELTKANKEKPASKKRGRKQIAAIAYSAARKRK